MRGFARRLRSNFGIGSSRMAIRSQMAWYWRWLLNFMLMVLVGCVVWWLVQNSYRITGVSFEEARQQMNALSEENARLKHELDVSHGTVIERERQLQIDKAAQGELARTVAQLQDENAAIKEDLGFLRKVMSSGGSAPEGLNVSDLKLERDGRPNDFRYRMLLMQGGQRKQDFRGRVQVVARVAQGNALETLTFPDPAAAEAAGTTEFRFYQKVEGRFSIPEGATLKSAEIRVLAVPGGQVKLSRTINMP
jgi:hypothetical protein